TSRELGIVRHGHLPHSRSHQHVRPKEELFLISIEPFFLGEFQKERAHDRHARARALFGQCIYVRQHPIPLFDKLLSPLFVLSSVYPGLAVDAALTGMVPINWREGT